MKLGLKDWDLGHYDPRVTPQIKHLTSRFFFFLFFMIGSLWNLQIPEQISLDKWSVRVAERLALPTSDHGVACSNPAGGEILPEPKRRFVAQSLSCSPFHRLEITEILLKGRKTLTHPSIQFRQNGPDWTAWTKSDTRCPLNDFLKFYLLYILLNGFDMWLALGYKWYRFNAIVYGSRFWIRW